MTLVSDFFPSIYVLFNHRNTITACVRIDSLCWKYMHDYRYWRIILLVVDFFDWCQSYWTCQFRVENDCCVRFPRNTQRARLFHMRKTYCDFLSKDFSGKIPRHKSAIYYCRMFSDDNNQFILESFILFIWKNLIAEPKKKHKDCEPQKNLNDCVLKLWLIFFTCFVSCGLNGHSQSHGPHGTIAWTFSLVLPSISIVLGK